MGKIRDVIKRVEIKVLMIAPGVSIIDKQNIPKMTRNRY